jgi:ATP-dependent helicase/nuclease subunit A
MKLTPSQHAAVTHRGGHLLVAASAGSGKTEVLARRCVGLVADAQAPCSVEQLLVVTFTRAAAAELRVRIARMLRETADTASSHGLREHLRRQAVLVDAADIGTIDSWCGRLVREHFNEAGIDPAFTMLSDSAALLLREEQLESVMDWVYRDADPLAAAVREWLGRSDRPDDRGLRDLLRQLNGFRDNLLLPEQWLAAAQEACAAPAAAAAAEARRMLAAALRAECVFQAGQLGALVTGDLPDVLARYGTALNDWEAQLDDPARLLEVARGIEEFSIGLRGVPKEDQPRLKNVRDRWLKRRLQKQWSATALEPIVATAAEAAGRLAVLLRLEARYAAALAEVKQQRGAYGFGDIQRAALQLLGTPQPDGTLAPTPVALALRQRYAHVLVDEYQDTSPVQVELLRLVSRGEAEAGNRFMVGDLKQSIYGFRQAEPRLFAAQLAAFADGREAGRVQYLSDNFRTHARLLAGLNELFAALFDPALGGTAFAAEEQLRAGRDEVANPTLDGAPRIDVTIVAQEKRGNGEAADDGDADGDEADELDRIEREACIVAQRVRAMLDGGTLIPQRGPDKRITLRPLRLSDVVVLLRSAARNAGLVAGVLRAAGLPCVTGGRDALLDVPEVRDICDVLRLLANRQQDVPLAAYLRSPLAGLTPADLLAIRALTPDVSFAQAVAAYGAGGTDAALLDRLRRALARLDHWAAVARHAELPQLVQRIIGETHHAFFAAARPGGPQRTALLHALVRFAAEFAAGGQHGVAEFVEHLEELERQDALPSTALAVGQDVIRVMTVHASKGLEFPVVFVLNAGAGFNRSSGNRALQLDTRAGLGLSCFDYPTRRELRMAAHHTVRLAVLAREREEELRLLYVALTRAREHLTIIGHAKAGALDEWRELYAGRPLPLIARLSAASVLEWVGQALVARQLGAGQPPAVAVHELDAASVPSPEAPTAADDQPPAWSAADDEWVAAGRAALAAEPDLTLARYPAVLSVSALKDLATRDPAADQPRALDFVPAPLGRPAFAGAAGADGRDFGTACHRFLQHADLTALGDAAAVGRQIAALVADGRLESDEAALLSIDDLVWLAGSPAGEFLTAHAAAVQREVPVVYALPVGAGDERAIVRGIIDCLVPTNEGLVLFDYKTDHPADEVQMQARVEKYRVQLQAYGAAAAAVFGRPVVRLALLFLAARVIVEVPPRDRPLAALLESAER